MPMMETLKTICEELSKLRSAVKDYKEKKTSDYYAKIMLHRPGKIDFFTEIEGGRAMLQFFSKERKEVNDEQERKSMALVIDILKRDFTEFEKLPDISGDIKLQCTKLIANLDDIKKELSQDRMKPPI